MKTFCSLLLVTLVSAQALAHPSVVPHDHPHDASLLPDLGALLMSAVFVGAAILARRLFRKG